MDIYQLLLLIHEPLFGAINNSNGMEVLNNYLIHIAAMMVILGIFALFINSGNKNKRS